jgi:CheY-like chemotaxis protein/two-component sensor histidine kinase
MGNLIVKRSDDTFYSLIDNQTYDKGNFDELSKKLLDSHELQVIDLKDTVDSIFYFFKSKQPIKKYNTALCKETRSHDITFEIVLNTIINKFEDKFKKEGVILTTKIQPEMACYSLDEVGTSLTQSLVNLVENTYEAVRQNKIKLIDIEVSKTSDKEYTISVQDNGPGISPDIEQKIFDHYFTTKGQQNSGVGLYLVSKYVSINKGQITLDKDILNGTKFVISLPFKKRKDKKNILIVNDEKAILEVLVASVAGDNNIFLATDGNSALEIIRNNKIDVIISDYKMPIITGTDLFKMTEDLQGGIPFLMFTGCSKEEIDNLPKNKENFKMIQKPDMEALFHHMTLSMLKD